MTFRPSGKTRSRLSGQDDQGEEEHEADQVIGIIAVLALIGAACSDGDEPRPRAATATRRPRAPGTGGSLADFGESTDADPALVDKALGPVEPSDEASWNIILASIARANQDLDQATIDKAMECWSNQECDTGTGGEIVMGYADGGGDTVNVWRAVSHMEAILQALTYDEIGTIVSTEANFDPDPAVPANDIRFLISGGRLHRRLPRHRGGPRRGVLEADDARASRTSRSRRAGSVFPTRKVPSSPVRTT